MALTPDEKSKYESKESLLNVIRAERIAKQPDNQNLGRNANVSAPAWRTTSDSDSIVGSVESEGRGTTSAFYGGNVGTEDGKRSSRRFARQLRPERVESPGGNGSTYQPQRPTGVVSGIKGTYNRYKEAFRKENTGTTTATKKKVEGRKLTDAEAIRARPKLVEFILWQSEHMDQFIIATTVGHDPTIEIWGDISKDEAEIIADFLISRGKTNVQTATAIRHAIVFIDRLRLGLIIGPRLYRTMMTYFERGFSIR